MKALLPWATSLGTLWGMWAVSQKHWWGWLIGLVNQVLWISFSVAFAAWGLLPLSAALTVIYVRALVQWRRDDAPPLPEIVRVPKDEIESTRLMRPPEASGWPPAESPMAGVRTMDLLEP